MPGFPIQVLGFISHPLTFVHTVQPAAFTHHLYLLKPFLYSKALLRCYFSELFLNHQPQEFSPCSSELKGSLLPTLPDIYLLVSCVNALPHYKLGWDYVFLLFNVLYTAQHRVWHRAETQETLIKRLSGGPSLFLNNSFILVPID